MMQDQQQLEEILKNLKEVTPLEPSPFLYAKIRHRISEELKRKEIFSGKFILKISGVFMLLVILNVSALYIIYPIETIKETSTVAEELGLITDNYYDNNY
jgi:hypothetical protein